MSFGPDGTTLASGGADGSILLWDVTTGERIRALRGHTYPPVAMIFGADGGTMVSGAESVRTWDTATGRVTGAIPTQERGEYPTPLVSMALSPYGKYLATDAADGNAMLWDVASGEVVRTLEGHTGAVNALAFHRDGTALASGGEDRAVLMWDLT
ncbi:hypothetical protein BJF79_01735 [Actinomadura sp. CNU-125]|nr:hypothetical protein BJF79_01735 [Actinomadura sp. CNU-125]